MTAELDPRRERLALASILGLALALRVAYTLQARANPYFLEPAVDQGFWVEWGRAVAAGGSHGEGPFPRGPLYAWFLGGVFALTDGSLLAARLVQDVVGTAGVLLVHAIGRRVLGARAGLVGALLAATSWVLIYFDGELLRASPTATLTLCGLWLALRLDERPGARGALATGAAFGLTALLRAQVLAFVPVLLVWLAWRRRRARELLLVLAGLALPLLPVTAYNAFVGGDAVLISPEGGTVLWHGNHPAADGVTSVPPGVRGGFREHIADEHAQAERALGRSLEPSAASRYWLGRTLEHARAHPGDALALLGRKLVLFWSDWEYGNPEEPRFFARRFVPWTRLLPVGFGLMAGLALVGAVAGLRARRRGAGLLVAFVLVYMGTVVLFLVAARYRAPVVPVLAVLAGGGVVTVRDAWRAGRLGAAVAGLLAAALVLVGSLLAPAPRDASEANGLWWLGLAEARAGQQERALELYDEALALRPDFAYLHAARGRALYALGRADEARAALGRAVELDPLDPSSLDALAALERQAGDLRRARELAGRSIARDPTSPDPWYTLGRIELAERDPAAALRCFATALELDPFHANAAYAFASLSLERGDSQAAVTTLERLLSSDRPLPPELLQRARDLLEAAR